MLHHVDDDKQRGEEGEQVPVHRLVKAVGNRLVLHEHDHRERQGHVTHAQRIQDRVGDGGGCDGDDEGAEHNGPEVELEARLDTVVFVET